MAYVVTLACVDTKDKACIEECPSDCIYEGDRSMYINPDECIECGACEAACPVEAIFFEDDLPESDIDWKDVAEKFFEETGLSGGASAAGAAGKDEARVAAIPAK